MEITLLLEYKERQQLRAWLQENHSSAKECWVTMSRSKNPVDGRLAQRLSPRRKNSHWTELNKLRCNQLEERGLMTQAGRDALNNAL